MEVNPNGQATIADKHVNFSLDLIPSFQNQIKMEQSVSLGHRIISLARSIGLAIKNSINGSDRAFRGIGATRLAAGVSAPFAVAAFVDSGRNLAYAKTVSDATVAGLSLAGSTGEILDIVGTTIQGVQVVQGVQIASWIGSAFLVGGVLQVLGIIAAGIGVYKTNCAVKDLDKALVGEGDVEKKLGSSIEQLLARDDKYIKRHFKISNTKGLRKILETSNQWIKSDNKDDQEHGVDLAKRVISSLKERGRKKMRADKLSILAGAVHLVGLGMVLLTTLGTFGFSLLAVGTAIGIGAIVYSIRSNYNPIKLPQWLKSDGASGQEEVELVELTGALNPVIQGAS